MAMVLLIGAPALISVIEDTMTEDISYVGDYLPSETGFRVVTIPINDYVIPEGVSMSNISSYENNTLTVIQDHTEVSSKIKSFGIYDNNLSNFINGVTKISITSDVNISSINFWSKVNDVTKINDNFVNLLDENDLPTNTWVYTLNSIDKVRLTSDDLVSYWFGINLVPGYDSDIFIADITAEYGSTINYGEIIIGLTGGLLLTCALFATPWFGAGGLNIKKTRRS
jgi:hypothetical protein